MSKFWICLVLLAASAITGRSQAKVSPVSILSTARIDPALGLHREQLDYMRQTNLRLPLVEQIGLRTESERFELRRQEYLGRANLNGLKEISRQRRLNSAKYLEEASRERIFLHEALLQRYEVLVEYRQLQGEIAAQQQLILVYDDKIRVLRKLLEMNVDADVDELIDTEYDRDELALRLAGAENRLLQLRQIVQDLGAAGSGDWQLDTSGFIQPLQLEGISANLGAGQPVHPEIVEKEAEIARIDAEYQFEKAKSHQMLDFVQMRYRDRPEDPFNYDFSVGIGITLPYQGSARVKMNNLKIEKKATDTDIQQLRLELMRQLKESQQRLATMSVQYGLARKQWATSQAQFTLQQAAAGIPAPEPLVLLRAKELALKRALRVLEMEREIFECYLEILDWSGQLSSEPLINYLSAGLEKI